ncbi:hypothetical protein PFISCL1PPCAC_3521, partial [Pristionchus fissidentatus]
LNQEAEIKKLSKDLTDALSNNSSLRAGLVVSEGHLATARNEIEKEKSERERAQRALREHDETFQERLQNVMEMERREWEAEKRALEEANEMLAIEQVRREFDAAMDALRVQQETELSKLREEFDTMTALLDQLREEKEKINAERAGALNLRDGYRRRCEELSHELNEYHRPRSQKELRISAPPSVDVENLEEEIDNLKREVDRQKNELEAGKRSSSQLETELLYLRQERERLVLELRETREKTENALNEERNRLSSELQAANDN